MNIRRHLIVLFCLLMLAAQGQAQSIAREWNELLLTAIRNDLARPTVHARNLFHISAAIYDAWAAYDSQASTYFLAHTHRGYYFENKGVQRPAISSKREYQEEAISYAAFRLLLHRFQYSPGYELVRQQAQALMAKYSFDPEYVGTENYATNSADLGNYIAASVIAFGMGDGSNEAENYANRVYEPVNSPMYPDAEGVNGLTDPNRWQPLSFEVFIGQSGISEGPSTPEFVGPEWGAVVPFALDKKDLTTRIREGAEYLVYHDPGPPAYLDPDPETPGLQDYQWGFGLVARWSAHLDPNDGVRWDISPASLGNIPLEALPVSIPALRDFYDLENGGDISTGYAINPISGQPYQPQNVLRADYARVLAEFWADGPDSETPPGHWFVVLNYVNDHPAFERKYKGEGMPMDPLEWNVKSYMALGGAVHDVAVSAWGIKGYYDYIRPISAIRSMAERGQSSDPNLPRYHPAGIPLVPGQVEIVSSDDPLNEFGDAAGKIKIRAWKIPGRFYVGTDETRNVDWILGSRWQPYQRPTFVTPPFAGYVSGHSTFSRAAAEVLSALTGSEYFPGGMGEFLAKKNDFLVFEEGPSEDVTLQWARYQDASDQCSLSRIWGGIHPPVDDIPGRKIGYQIGMDAFALADQYFNGMITEEQPPQVEERTVIGPNPITGAALNRLNLYVLKPDDLDKEIAIYNASGRLFYKESVGYIQHHVLDTHYLQNGVYFLTVTTGRYVEKHKLVIVR